MDLPALTPLTSLLQCPRSGDALAETAEGFRCAACALTFPAVGKVPWLYRDPAAKLAEWRGLYDVAMAEMTRQEERLKGQGKAPQLSALTKRRQQKELQARVEQRKAVETLLAPLGSTAVQQVDLLRVLGGKAAGTQVLTSYAVNAIRDWGWDETDENRLALEHCRAALARLPNAGSRAPFKAAAVLGAGAGRLAYDLHEAGVQASTVTLDINPFLTLAFERVASGKSLTLQEFPLSPDSLEHVAVARKLAAPAKARPGLSILFGDVLDAPLKRGAFDLVVTPWLLDILPEDPATFARRVNALLAPGGVWLYHGSFAFPNASLEEVLEIVAQTGFQAAPHALDRVPYLSSPVSCQARAETVLTFAATKGAAVAEPEPYKSLPPFLADARQPLPRHERLAQLMATHGFHAEVLALVDGRRTVVDVSSELERRYGAQPGQLFGSVLGFLASMYELTRG